jgi:mannose-6-phosphate isomerase-like protein (cupin superfamily)
VTNKPATFEDWYVQSSYQNFVKNEEVPLYEGSTLEDLASLPLKDWQRRGGKAAYTRLGNQESSYNLQIAEIPPKGELRPERHMYDAVMFVMKGRGATSIWQEGESKRTVEWEEGSLLAIPLNAWHQEFNSSSDEPCRIFFCTNMPQVINWYRNLDYVFNNSFVFKDRYSYAAQDYFIDSKHWAHRTLETNFLADVRAIPLDDNPVRGHRHSVIRFAMTATSIGIHVAEVTEGTYMTAHRHGAGAHVIVVQGQGYEILYMPGEEKKRRRVPLKPYAVVSPQHNEFHQHFNTGKGPFRMLAFRGNSPRFGWGKPYTRVSPTAQTTDRHAESFNITYEMEDPSIREEYYRELEKNGVTSRLPPLNQGAG